MATGVSDAEDTRADPPVPSIAEFRHRSEMPMVALTVGIMVALLAVVVAIGALLGSEQVGKVFALAAVLLPNSAAFALGRWRYWTTISQGVEVTADQLPDVYEVFVAQATAMGMTRSRGRDRLPQLYVINGQGKLSASAAKETLFRAYVVVSSDLLDAAGAGGGDPTSLQFVLARELGHIKAGHLANWRRALMPIANLLFIGRSVSRAQEYTADRIASYYVPDGITIVMALYAGQNVYSRVDLDAYIASLHSLHSRFWLPLANLFQDSPVGFRRMQALARTRTEGWDVHGRML